MNFYGRLFGYYLSNSAYLDVSNQEPVRLDKNTFQKVMTRIKLIDSHIKKPLENYTSQDMNTFIQNFVEGKIKAQKGSNKQLRPHAIKFYVREFKRFVRVFRAHNVKNNRKFNPLEWDWVNNLKAPKMKTVYEDYPSYKMHELVELGNEMTSQEYKIRVLLSLNLMGRKCEMSALLRKNIDVRGDGSIWVKLPEVKKHSHYKNNVELWAVVKKELIKYLDRMKFGQDDVIFPSREEAFTKNLKVVSARLYGKDKRISPKILRKLGVCIAEELGYSREEVERIGGWAVNSPVLGHYFNRKKDVAVRKKGDDALEKALHSDLYTEMERSKQKSRKAERTSAELQKQLDVMQNQMKKIELFERLLEKKVIGLSKMF